MLALSELRRFVEQQELPSYLTDELALIVKSLHVFFDSEGQMDFAESVLSYIYNVLLAASKQAIKTSDYANVDRMVGVKNGIKMCMQGEVVPQRLAIAFNAAANAALRRRANHKRLQKQTATQGSCYICHDVFLKSDQCRVDHVFPKRSGGSDDPRNLGRAHEYCEAPKGHIAYPSDAAIWGFAFHELPTFFRGCMNDSTSWELRTGAAERVPVSATDLGRLAEKLNVTQLRIAMLRRQRHRCYTPGCGNLVGSSSALIKKNSNIPWSYTNAAYACAACATKYKEKEQHNGQEEDHKDFR